MARQRGVLEKTGSAISRFGRDVKDNLLGFDVPDVARARNPETGATIRNEADIEAYRRRYRPEAAPVAETPEQRAARGAALASSLPQPEGRVAPQAFPIAGQQPVAAAGSAAALILPEVEAGLAVGNTPNSNIAGSFQDDSGVTTVPALPENQRGIFLDGFNVTGSPDPQALSELRAGSGLERDVAPPDFGAPFATNAQGQLIERTQDYRRRTTGEVDARRNLRNDFIRNSALYEMEKDPTTGGMKPKLDDKGQPIEKIPKTFDEWRRKKELSGEFKNKSATEINSARKDFDASRNLEKAIESGNQKEIDVAFGNKASRAALSDLTNVTGKTEFDIKAMGRSKNTSEKQLFREYTSKLNALTDGYKKADLAKYEIDKLSEFKKAAQDIGNQSMQNKFDSQLLTMKEKKYEAQADLIGIRNNLTKKQREALGITNKNIGKVDAYINGTLNQGDLKNLTDPIRKWFESRKTDLAFSKDLYQKIETAKPEDVEVIILEALASDIISGQIKGFQYSSGSRLDTIIKQKNKLAPIL